MGRTYHNQGESLSTTDYIKASTTSACTTFYDMHQNSICYNGNKTHNWLYASSDHPWTLSGNSNDITIVWSIYSVNSSFYYGSHPASDILSVRPTVYLNSNITLSGKGTQSEPYVIN